MKDVEQSCDTIQSLTVNGSEDVGVTVFEQEACTSVEAMGNVYTSSSTTLVDSRIQNLTEYFSRPRCIQSAVWPTTTGAVYTVPISAFSLFNTLFPNLTSRMEGVYGYRFTLVFTVQVAAHPFHAGLLAACFQYGNSGQPNVFKRFNYSWSCTNIPHVRMDLSESTMVQLKVPFSSYLDYLTVDYGNMNEEYGNFSLVSILPTYNVSGTNSPRYTVYVHIEDLELFGSTSEAVTTVTLQSGTISGPEISTPYSGNSVLSKSLKTIATSIPKLDSVPRPLSSILSAGASLAKSFGYSMPNTSDPISRMFPAEQVAETNVDLVSPCTVLAPFSTTSVPISSSISNANVDEMAFEFILSQWGQLNRNSIVPSMTTGTVAYGCAITPSALWYREPTLPTAGGNFAMPTVGGATANSFFPTHIFNLAKNFRFWRGGFVFRITFAKTKFHVGRVLLAYEPTFSYWSPGSASVAARVGALSGGVPQPFVYSKIFDFKDGNVVEFEVPYTCAKQHCSWYENIGTFTMSIMNPLDGPTTVPAVAPYLVEVKAMPDFELNNVRTPLYPVANPTTATIKLQSGGITVASPPSAGVEVFGERVRSVKTLICIPSVCPPNAITASTTSFLSIYPWFYTNMPSLATPNNVAPAPESFSFGATMSKCYQWARGSTNLHVYYYSDGSTANPRGLLSTLTYHPNTFGNNTDGIPDVTGGSSSANPRVTTIGGAPLHVNIPLSIPQAKISTALFDGANWSLQSPTLGARLYPSNSYAVPLATPVLTERAGVGSFYTRYATRAAGDDAVLGMYMGPPLLYLPGNGIAAADYDATGGSWLGNTTLT